MNMKLKQTILLTGFSAAMLTAGSSFAACTEGPYIRANVAAAWLETQTYQVHNSDMTSLPEDSRLRISTNAGWDAGVAVGSQNGPYRLEAALDYLSNNMKSGTVNDGSTEFSVEPSGRVSATTLLVNGYYDFKPESTWTPYVGAGFGMANVNVSLAVFDSPNINMHDDSNQFAYQGIVGASWNVTDRVKANVDYRYLGTTRATFNALDDSENKAQLKSHYSSNRVAAGITYFFE